MKNLKINYLNIKNFAGIREFESEFGDDVSIYGSNGSGKTTIANSISWLLFGKDIEGNSEFGIKTHDQDGNDIHGLDHVVNAVIEIDEQEHQLSRTLREKWTKRRGSEESEFGGHETLFEIDGVGVRKKDFEEFVSGICDESVFRLLTNPHPFNELSWQKRRELLFSMIGEISDLDIAKEKFPELVEYFQKQDTEKVKERIKSDKKKANEKLKELPGRIDEVEQSKPDMTNVEWAKEQLPGVEEELQEIEKELEGLKSENKKKFEEKEGIWKDLEQKRERLMKLKEEREESERKEKERLQGEYQEVYNDVVKKKQEYDNVKNEIDRIDNEISKKNRELEQTRKDWHEVNEWDCTVKEDETHCPTCKRPYENVDTAQIVEHKKNERDTKLKEIEAKGQRLKSEVEKLEKERGELQEKLTAIEKEIADLNDKLAEKRSERDNVKAEKSDTEEDLQAEIDKLRESAEKQPGKQEESEKSAKLRQQKEELEQKRDYLKEEIAKETQVNKADKRIEELEQERQEQTKNYAHAEKIEDMLNDLIKHKISIVNEKLSELFAPVQFKMFEEQINGGLKPTCQTMYNGRVWDELSTGEKIKAGLHIVKALQGFYENKSPVIIDNHESVTKAGTVDMPEVDCQIIRLYASENKELEVQNET